MTTWWLVDGKRYVMKGSWDDTLEKLRELRADGHDIKQAKAPKSGAPKGYGTASSHIRR